MKKFNRPVNLSDITTLLANLKAREAEYPASLLAARRAEFLKNVAGLQMHQGQGPSNVNGQGGTPSATNNASPAAKSLGSGLHTASQTLNGILYAVVGVLTTIILAEAGYLYREEIREFFIPGSRDVVSTEIYSPPPEASETPISPSPSPTVTGTITKAPILPTTKPDQTPQPATTLDPLITPTDPGLHLGQTKTPKP